MKAIEFIMITCLLYHDIISYGRSLLLYLALNLAMSSFFAMVDDPTWWMYIIIGSGQIAGVATMYILRSKQCKSEVLLFISILSIAMLMASIKYSIQNYLKRDL